MLASERGLASALAYARWFGWAVFPVGGDNGKKPLTAHGVKDSSSDAATIRERWPDRPCNVAAAAGAVSGFWVLDVDGEDGAESLAALERQHGPIPPSPRQLTPSGGSHLLFAYTPGLRNRVRVAPGLDVRTDNGYAVVAPSSAPGRARPWAWDVDYHIADIPLAAAPLWLLRVLTEEPSRPISDDADLPPWIATACASIPEGQRNDTAARVIGHLLRRWTEPQLAFALVRAWNAAHCRPPLPTDELARTFNSVLAKELRRRGALL